MSYGRRAPPRFGDNSASLAEARVPDVSVTEKHITSPRALIGFIPGILIEHQPGGHNRNEPVTVMDTVGGIQLGQKISENLLQGVAC
jgi:hypothetical protein